MSALSTAPSLHTAPSSATFPAAPLHSASASASTAAGAVRHPLASRYVQSALASVEELVARDIEAYSRRRRTA
ncbi:MAG: hypothetical protein ACTMIR_11970 [Cellulomonadaceae bacterium]